MFFIKHTSKQTCSSAGIVSMTTNGFCSDGCRPTRCNLIQIICCARPIFMILSPTMHGTSVSVKVVYSGARRMLTRMPLQTSCSSLAACVYILTHLWWANPQTTIWTGHWKNGNGSNRVEWSMLITWSMMDWGRRIAGLGQRGFRIVRRDDNCANNGQTTWTYNQGVILSGLGLLYNATGNSSVLEIAQKIADATIEHLTYPDGILRETCEPSCDNDQKLFKGIFVRHLAYLIPFLTDPVHIRNYTSFVERNAASVWTSKQCELDGLFSVIWDNQTSSSCESSRNVASTSSALDLFLSVAKTQPSARVSSSSWMLFGLGNCMDDRNSSMPNFYKRDVKESVCRATANEDTGAVGYDYQLDCLGIGFCRIRTLSDQHQTPPGWTYEDGNARNVTRSNKLPLTSCFLKLD